MKNLIILGLTLLLVNSCKMYGVTNDFDQLTDKELQLIAPFKTFEESVPGKVYEINAGELKEDMKRYPKSLVYIFANWCSSSGCQPLSVYKEYAIRNGYNLYLVISGYHDLNKTLKQNIGQPLYTIDSEFYKTKYSRAYIRKFRNELMELPVETKLKDCPMDGSLFFFNFGILDTVRGDYYLFTQ